MGIAEDMARNLARLERPSRQPFTFYAPCEEALALWRTLCPNIPAVLVEPLDADP